MRDAALPGAPQPFADDAAGSGYFSSDHHHRYLAEALVRQLAKGCNVVLVSGAPPADGELLARFVDEAGSKYRASVVACRSGMNFNDLMVAYSRHLGIGVNRDKGRLWALLSHLMLEGRRGIHRVLVLDHAEALDALCFDELLRFSQLDAPRPVPLVLLGSPAFADLLKSPSLDFVNAAITGRLALDRLAPEEVGAFIQYQLNGLSEGGASPFSSELIALIATAADGNPAIVNALAREIVLSVKPRRLTVDEMREPEPEAEPVDGAEASPASAETNVAPTDLALAPASAAPPRRRARRLGMDLQIAGYLGLSILIGAGLLYELLPRSAPPSAAVIEPAAENAAMAVLPSAAPETATAEADNAPTEPAPETQASADTTPPAPEPQASADATPPAPEPAAPAAAVPAVESSDSAAAPAAQAPVLPPAVASSDNAPPAPPQPPSPAAPSSDSAAPAAPPPAVTEARETATDTPAAQSALLAAVEPEAAPRAALSSDEVAIMMQRGNQLLATGDIVSARQFYERAAASGNAAALYGVGRSFDPLVLRKLGVLGLAGDAATAIVWYRKAAEAGSAEASQRLKQLAANDRPGSNRR